MEMSPEAYFALDGRLNDRFRGLGARDWSALAKMAVRSAAHVPPDARLAVLTREKASHRGIGGRKALKDLIAGAVDQDFLDEICTLDGLERLELAYPVTARSLEGLRALKRLRHLKIDSPRNVTDFRPLLALPSLTTLIVENAKHLGDIGWLADAHHLEVIGIEGSMTRNQTLASLAPLAGLTGLRAFLATGVRLVEKDLFPLAECPRLEYLGCGRFAPRREFMMLHQLKPRLVCSWFHPGAWDPAGR